MMTAKTVLFRDPNLRKLAGGSVGDWLHINSASFVGPNRHFDAGDNRFHPDNIIWDSREANIIAITDRKTGNITWRLGPNYDGSEAESKLGWIIGQHHAHIIPRGLPGEGNLLVFDNGGWAGYGKPNPCFANRPSERKAGLFAGFGDRPDLAQNRLAVYARRSGFRDAARRFTLLQPLHQQRPASAQWQYAGHRRIGWSYFRSHPRPRAGLGIYQPLLGQARTQYGLPGLSGALCLGPAAPSAD